VRLPVGHEPLTGHNGLHVDAEHGEHGGAARY
jgi:hypothetical protein